MSVNVLDFASKRNATVFHLPISEHYVADGVVNLVVNKASGAVLIISVIKG